MKLTVNTRRKSAESRSQRSEICSFGQYNCLSVGFGQCFISECMGKRCLEIYSLKCSSANYSEQAIEHKK